MSLWIYTTALIVLFSLYSNRIVSGENCCTGSEAYENFCFSTSPTYDGKIVPRCIEDLPKVTMTYYTNEDRTVGKPISRNEIPQTFDSTKPCRFIVHEWLNSPDDIYAVGMKDTMLDTVDGTIIVVDWRLAAQSSNYDQVIADSQTIGKEISLIMRILMNSFNMPYSKFSCMGVGFGGQICGLAGNYDKLGKIAAFDPIGPGFQQRDPAGRLNPGSADSVAVSHTAALGDKNIGIYEPCGDVDYYPNGGGNQPECKRGLLSGLLSGIFNLLGLGWRNSGTLLGRLFGDEYEQCSHFTAVRLWIESKRSNQCVVRQECTDYKDLPGSCTGDPSTGPTLQIIGHSSEYPARAIFYLTTNAKAPYCKG